MPEFPKKVYLSHIRSAEEAFDNLVQEINKETTLEAEEILKDRVRVKVLKTMELAQNVLGRLNDRSSDLLNLPPTSEIFNTLYDWNKSVRGR